MTIFCSVSALILLKIIGADAKLTVLLFSLIIVLLSMKIKDLITSSLLLTLYSLQFYLPNKYYAVEVFKPDQVIFELGGYVLSYGVNLENIFLLVTLFLILRKIYLKKQHLKKLKLKFVIPIAISGMLYFFVSLYSSIVHSPYLNLSLTWLMQFMQLFILGFCLLYVFINTRKNFELVFPTILASIFLQGTIAILQFVKQSWIGLPVESFRVSLSYYGALDAVDNLFRVTGTFGQPNQLALIVLAMLTVIIPYAIVKKTPIYSFGVILGIMTVFLTQSRSSWIALLAIAILFGVAYWSELAKQIKLLGKRKLLITAGVILIASSAVILPRILKSFNSFSQGAGVPLRKEMLKESKYAIVLNPWAGYGIGANEPALLALFPNGYNRSFPAPVHMGYAQVALESGILGLIFLIFPFFYIVRSIFNNYLIWGYTNIRKYKSYVSSTLAGILIFSIFYLFQPHEGVREACYLGITLGWGIISLYLLETGKNV